MLTFRLHVYYSSHSLEGRCHDLCITSYMVTWSFIKHGSFFYVCSVSLVDHRKDDNEIKELIKKVTVQATFAAYVTCKELN